MILAWIIIVLLIIVSLYLYHENKSLKAKKNVPLVGTLYGYWDEDIKGYPDFYFYIDRNELDQLRHDQFILLEMKVVSHK